MTKIIAVANQKGGVSKTTTTHNLARGLKTKKNKVLVIDLDPQINLSNTRFNVKDVNLYPYTIIPFLKEDYTNFRVYQDSISKIDLLVGSKTLIENDYGRNDLKKTLENVKNTGTYEYILIDCPPKPMNKQYNTLTEMALIASDYLISPFNSEAESISGLENLIDHIIRIKKHYNTKLEFLGFFFNRVEFNTREFKKYHLELEQNEYYLKVFIRKDQQINNAKEKGRTVIDYDPNSRAAKDFLELSKIIKKKIK